MKRNTRRCLCSCELRQSDELIPSDSMAYSPHCCPTNRRYHLVLAGMADPSLPWMFRRRFADLMKTLWIDRPPFHPLILPRRVRIAVDDVRANSPLRALCSSEEKAEITDFGITDPQKITDNFVVLQVTQIALCFCCCCCWGFLLGYFHSSQ